MLTYSGSLVKKYSQDFYQVSLFCSQEQREALWSIFALNYELSSITHKVKDPSLCQIRFKWWEEVIEKLFEGEIEQHQIITDLKKTIDQFDISLKVLKEIIITRSERSHKSDFVNNREFLSYINGTSVSLFMLSGSILGIDDRDKELMEKIGFSWGLVEMIRSFKQNLSKNIINFPLDLLKEYKLNSQNIRNDGGNADLFLLILSVVNQAYQNAQNGRNMLRSKGAWPLYALNELTQKYCRHLIKNKGNIFCRDLMETQPSQILWLTQCVLRAKIGL